MKKKTVTLDDIAEHTDLSKYSISRALADKSGVSEQTRERVLAAAKELGYNYSKPKRKTPKAARVLLLIPFGDASDPEFWMETLSGAEAEAVNLNIDLIIKPFKVHAQLQDLPSEGVDGVIIAGSLARKAAQPFIDLGVPAAMISYVNPLEAFDAITIADYEGGAAVAEHFLDLGHTRLAFVIGRMFKPSFRHRYLGFKDTALQANAQFQLFELDPEDTGVSFEQQFQELEPSAPHPTAILCSTDTLALSTIWALSRLGKRVPDDISVVGFNNSRHAKQFVPKLTSVDVPKFEIGKRTVRDLFERISGLRSIPTRTQFIPRLVMRASTAAPHTVAEKFRKLHKSR